MTARKHVSVLRAVIVSFALLLAVAFALSAQASAISTEASGSDAVTGATPQAPQIQDGQTPPQMPNGEMPQFSGGQSMPQMPNGDMPQFSDGQLPQMPDGLPGFDGENGEGGLFIQQDPAAEDEGSGDSSLKQRADAGTKSGKSFGQTKSGIGDSLRSSDPTGVSQIS